MTEEKLYDMHEMAEMFEVDVQVAKKWCERGRVRFVWVDGPQGKPVRRVPHSALLELIEQLFQVEGGNTLKELQKFKRRIRVFRSHRKRYFDSTLGRYRNFT